MNARIVRRQPSGGKNLVSTGNAKVFNFDNCEILLSYGVPVAVRLKRDFEAEGVFLYAGFYQTARKWSHTTSCHVSRYGASRAEEIPQSMLDTVYNVVSRK